ncbi:MAG: hypothetical protein JW775_04240 [Candidatus Aminicenantes bacterium]|nr:hypothetical protein [Candidatus Aminicenantes bacterium]
MTKRIILLALLAAATGLAQTVNCVVAIVNGEIITLLDVEVTAAFGLGHGPAADPDADPRLAALDALIDRRIVLGLAREVRGVSGEEIDAAVAELRASLGPEDFAAKLARFGLDDLDIWPYVEDRLLYERALELRFSQSIPVSFTEIERYYRDIYAPERARFGGTAGPLERGAGEIESRIQGERRARQATNWVRDMRSRADIEIKKDCLK